MDTHGFELKSFGLEIVNDLPGYWTGLKITKIQALDGRFSTNARLDGRLGNTENG